MSTWETDGVSNCGSHEGGMPAMINTDLSASCPPSTFLIIKSAVITTVGLIKFLTANVAKESVSEPLGSDIISLQTE